MLHVFGKMWYTGRMKANHVIAGLCVVGVGITCLAQTFNANPPLPATFGVGTYARTMDLSDNWNFACGYGDKDGNIANYIWERQGNNTVTSWTNGFGGGFINKFPVKISGNALYVGGYGDMVVFTPPFGTDIGPRAYREDAGGSNLFQVPVFAYATFCDLRGMSADGDVVVGRQFQGPFEYAYRFRISTFSLQDLGALPNQFGAAALGASGDGNTVVGRSGSLAFSWRPSEGMLSLGGLPGQNSAYATCAADNGLTIAGTSTSNVDRGFRWSPIVGMQQLPMLAGGMHLYPHAMDGNGWIIGGQSTDASGNPTAFIWTSTLGTQTVASHLLGRGLFGQLGNMVFTDVTGITPDGRGMCGLGTSGGVQMGWVARALLCGTMTGTNGTQFVCSGGSTNVLATGPVGGSIVGMTSFQWYRNNVLVVAGTQPGGSFISNTNSNVLQIQGVTASDVGSYFCIASSSGACVVQGPTTTLQLQSAPVVSLQPVDTQVCANQVASLTTLGTPVSGTAVYRWQKHVPPFPNVYADIFDGPTGNGSTFSGTGTATLSISNVQPADTERYRCLISDSICGPGNYESTNRVLLTVNSLTQVGAPIVNGSCLGSNSTLTVLATPVNSIYQWQRRVAPFPNVYADIFDGPTGNGGSFIGTQSATLTITNVSAADLTRYRCVVTGPCSSNISPNALLTSIDIPNFAGQTADVYVCTNNGAAFFNVNVSPGNYGLLTYQWYGPSGPLTDGPQFGGHIYSGSNTQTLSINPVSTAAVGGYSVVVQNACGGFGTAPSQLTYCPGDFNCDGSADFFDYLDFVDAYSANWPNADFNGDDSVDFFDYLDFVDAYSAGC